MFFHRRSHTIALQTCGQPHLKRDSAKTIYDIRRCGANFSDKSNGGKKMKFPVDKQVQISSTSYTSIQNICNDACRYFVSVK